MAMAPIVLLADDDDAVPILLEYAIRRSGHDIYLRRVADGDEAIQYLSRKGEFADCAKYPFPSLLLLDLKMPKVTGFEVLEWKREQPNLESLPVVIWSSSNLAQDRERAERLGAVSYFEKPMETGGFLELLECLLRYQQSVGKTPAKG
jgi:CheY-like chemotaxis protein